MSPPKVFQKVARDGKNILQITPPLTTNPGTALGNLAYEVVDGRMLQTRSGVILKSTATLRIDSVIGIDVARTVKSTVLGLGSADLVFRDAGGSSTFMWENVPEAETVRDYILALRDEPAIWQFEPEGVGPSTHVHPALAIARSSSRADFGSGATQKSHGSPQTINGTIILAATPERIVRDVQLIDNGDGTVTDPVNHLMWIKSPWGTLWNGAQFSGEPIRLTWLEATELFGRGEVLLSRSEDHGVAFTSDERASTGIEFGFRRGSCRVSFAGFDDWRLPTVADWGTVFILSSDVVWPVGSYWTATGCKRWHPFESKWATTVWRHIESSIADKNPVAWCTHTEHFLDEHSDFARKVVFVRNTK